MKKTLSKILSISCALLSCCVVACDNGENTPPTTYTYYGVVQTLEGFDGLYMQVPDFGICQLPTYEEGKVPNLAIKEGDLLEIKFSSEIQVTKSYPAIISTPARSSCVCENDIGFEVTSEYYLLTLDYTQEIKEVFLFFDLGVGDRIYFWRSEGVPGQASGINPSGGATMRMEDYATATIEMITEARLTISLSLEQDMQEFLKYYAQGDLEIQGKSIMDIE